MRLIIYLLAAYLTGQLSSLAQGEYTTHEAVRAAKEYFAKHDVWVFSPHVPGIPARIALSSEDKVIAGALIEKAIKEGHYRTGCWSPHHGFADAAEGTCTEIVICFQCRQGLFTHDGKIMWFAVGRSAEHKFNELFHKYGLDGSEPKPPNQALEPTTPAVTIPAAQEVAPAGVVAHL